MVESPRQWTEMGRGGGWQEWWGKEESTEEATWPSELRETRAAARQPGPCGVMRCISGHGVGGEHSRMSDLQTVWSW